MEGLSNPKCVINDNVSIFAGLFEFSWYIGVALGQKNEERNIMAMNTKTQSVSSSAHPKNGRLYAVIWYLDEVTGKTKPVWRSLGLDEGTKSSIVNKRLREVTNAFEEELRERLLEDDSEASLQIYEYMVKWLDRVKNSLQLNTYRSYSSMINGRIKHFFQKKPELKVSTIRSSDIEDFYAKLFDEGVTANTVIHYHAVMRKAFSHAFKNEIIQANPFDRVERPKKNKFQGQSFSEDELKALLNLAQNDPIYPVIILSGCMGLRRSEALGARWSRVDWNERTILIDTKIVELKEAGHGSQLIPVEDMKNKSSKRTLPLPQPVFDMLMEYKVRKENYKQIFKGAYSREYDDYICVDELGRLYKPSYVTNHFGVLLKQLGMKVIRFHDLRHTFASILINSNKPLIEVSGFLGHSDISTTANIYAHLDKSSKQGCADAITEIFEGKESKKGTR